ncbi:solute carrier family 23 protein [Staphylococcus nepalensis]
MDKNLKDKTNWLGGLQWFFFIFANIVIIPLTIGEAFHLSQDKVVATLQYSFVITGIACLFQAFLDIAEQLWKANPVYGGGLF